MNRRTFLKMAGFSALLSACSRWIEEADYTVEITQHQFFEPAALQIRVGQRVAWKNRDKTVHTVTCDETLTEFAFLTVRPANAEAFDSGAIYPGEIWQYVFKVPGEYMYFSRYRQESTSVGTVIVRG